MSGRRPLIGADSLFELLDLGSPDGTEWLLHALCAQTAPEVFFPEPGGDPRPAKRVCAGCSVRAECLAAAVARGEQYGVWGGLTARERRPLRRRAVAAAVDRLVA